MIIKTPKTVLNSLFLALKVIKSLKFLLKKPPKTVENKTPILYTYVVCIYRVFSTHSEGVFFQG